MAITSLEFKLLNLKKKFLRVFIRVIIESNIDFHSKKGGSKLRSFLQNRRFFFKDYLKGSLSSTFIESNLPLGR